MKSPTPLSTTETINALDNPAWRELLLGQLDVSVSPFHRHMAMSDAFQAAEKVGQPSSTLNTSDADCARLIEIGMIGEFPTRDPWRPVGTDVLFWFWTLTHPCFAETVSAHYATASDESRAYGLTLLATQSTPEAAAAMVQLLQEHPLPQNLPPRFFREINKRHGAIGPLLFPRLLLDAGPHLADVMNFLNACLESGTLVPAALSPASDWVSSEAIRMLGLVEPLQQSAGQQWRWDEEYGGRRSRLGVFLDLLGIIPDAPLEPCARALQLRDPLCVFFAVVSMLKKGQVPPNDAIEFVAESLETRAPLYKQLVHLGRGDLFPVSLLTFESFAAASMAEWLLYPSELGYEPAQLELMAKVYGVDEGKEVIMCLWRVIAEDRSAFAAASGPYEVDLPIGPIWGQNTFSNFTDWESRTPDEHLREIVETLNDWRVDWCKRGE